MKMKMIDYKDVCSKVCEVATKAGEYIAKQQETFSFDSVEFKGSHNLVSYVDKNAEIMIVDALRKLIPESGFITEEGTTEKATNEEFKWIIDPLDGTTNFVHGLPPYCVSIGLMHGAELVVGVVYEVTLKELFYAWKGSKAYLNGKEIGASKVEKLENSLVAVGFSYTTISEVDNFLDQIAFYQKNTDGVRRLGSATADLVYVACGRFDAYRQVNLSPWDVAAGALICKQAGAIVSDYRGGQDFIFGREIVATNPLVYDEFMKTLA